MARFLTPILILLGPVLLGGCASESSEAPRSEEKVFDLVIYGGTSSGVIAAVQASLLGKSVALIEPGSHLGGLTSGGLGATDIGNKAAIGGLAREFYRKVALHYSDDQAWRQQTREEYVSRRQSEGEDTMWTFEPHVAAKIFDDMVLNEPITVVFGERLDLDQGVMKEGSTISQISMQSGRVFRGRVFIDATYEGDLMAGAEVSYYVGREPNSMYDETLNGVQTENAVYHQFRFPVDPYIRPGDSESGLLPNIELGPPGEKGKGDKKVQAYNFRLCLTDVPDNQISFSKPENYDPLDYELLFRHFEAGEDRIPWINTPMPNRKTDINNFGAFSSDYIGKNYDYPEGDYETRERIFEQHEDYQKGLMWALANEERVPEAIRAEVSRWGLARDEFEESGGWPPQLYVREARRMIGEYVMTQHNCQGREVAPDSIGLAAYTMDSHHVQRYVDQNETARNEGDVQVGGFAPYPISYGAIIPKQSECSNLLVPVALSATHISFGSIRMEPVFMVLGQSAAIAACQAIDSATEIQSIDRIRFRERLISAGQVLEWEATE